MVEKPVLNIHPGQKFRHKKKGAVYVVKNIKSDTVLLISENGEAMMRIHLDSLTTSGLEPMYD